MNASVGLFHSRELQEIFVLKFLFSIFLSMVTCWKTWARVWGNDEWWTFRIVKEWGGSEVSSGNLGILSNLQNQFEVDDHKCMMTSVCSAWELFLVVHCCSSKCKQGKCMVKYTQNWHFDVRKIENKGGKIGKFKYWWVK